MSGVCVAGCGSCICKSCLFWWSSRCPFGECYDDHRAEIDPYDKAHPNDPPRTGWSNWKTDQAFWCRGGVTYPITDCPHYVKAEKSNVSSCLEANVQVFQDGYIQCSLVDSIGCEECMRRFEAKAKREEEDGVS